jgi:hypothetical protein
MISDDEDAAQERLNARPAHGRARGMRGSGSPVAAARQRSDTVDTEDDDRTVQWPHSRAEAAAADALQIVSPIGNDDANDEEREQVVTPAVAPAKCASSPVPAVAAAAAASTDSSADEVDEVDDDDDDVMDLLDELDNVDRGLLKESSAAADRRRAAELLEMSTETVEGSLIEADYDVVLMVASANADKTKKVIASHSEPVSVAAQPQTPEEEADAIADILFKHLLRESFVSAGVDVPPPQQPAVVLPTKEEVEEDEDEEVVVVVADTSDAKVVDSSPSPAKARPAPVQTHDAGDEDEEYSDDDIVVHSPGKISTATAIATTEQQQQSKCLSSLGGLPPVLVASNKLALDLMMDPAMSDEMDELYEFEFEAASPAALPPMQHSDPAADAEEAAAAAAALVLEQQQTQLERHIEAVKTETLLVTRALLDSHDARNGAEHSLIAKLVDPTFRVSR